MDVTTNRRITLEMVTKILVLLACAVTWANWELNVSQHWVSSTGQTHYWDVLLLILYPAPALTIFLKHLSRTHIVLYAYMLLFFATMIAFPHMR